MDSIAKCSLTRYRSFYKFVTLYKPEINDFHTFPVESRGLSVCPGRSVAASFRLSFFSTRLAYGIIYLVTLPLSRGTLLLSKTKSISHSGASVFMGLPRGGRADVKIASDFASSRSCIVHSRIELILEVPFE